MLLADPGPGSAKCARRRSTTSFSEARSASIHMNLGTAFFARKNYQQATESYQTAMRLDPDVFEHHFGGVTERGHVNVTGRVARLVKREPKARDPDRAVLDQHGVSDQPADELNAVHVPDLLPPLWRRS